MSNTKPKKKKPGRPKGSKSKPKQHSFFGTPEESANKKMTIGHAFIETGKYILFVLGGSIVGSLIGRPSVFLGIPIAVYAFYKKHNLLAAAAIAAAFTPVMVAPAKGTAGYDDMEGLDIKQLEADAKARLTAYLKSIGDKFYLPKPKAAAPPAAVNLTPLTGLNGNEEVTYFLNPDHMGEMPDMRSLDKIQENIARLAAGDNNANPMNNENNRGREVTGYEDGEVTGYEDEVMNF